MESFRGESDAEFLHDQECLAHCDGSLTGEPAAKVGPADAGSGRKVGNGHPPALKPEKHDLGKMINGWHCIGYGSLVSLLRRRAPLWHKLAEIVAGSRSIA